jgi:uncharacterized protein
MLSDVVREISGPAGPLEALIDRPSGDPRAVVIFGHPLPIEGGTMHTKMVYQGAKGLARAGCLVLRFNFRGVGRSAGRFDEGRGERDDFRAAIDYVVTAYPGREIWAAGASFGAAIAMNMGVADERVCALIGVAPPVDRYDFSAVTTCSKPKFIVHGERDELIPVKLIREFYAQLIEPRELVVIDDADHLFDGHTTEVGDALEDLLGDFSCTKP